MLSTTFHATFGSRLVEALYQVNDAPGRLDQVRIRAMNFGQHWRTPNIESVTWKVGLPLPVVIDFLTPEIEELYLELDAFPPEPDEPWDCRLIELGKPSVAGILAEPELLDGLIDVFGFDLLLTCFGDGENDTHDGVIVNSITAAHVADDRLYLSGLGRRMGTATAHQDF